MAKLNIDKEVIRDLADLLNETGLSEIEWSEGDVLVRVGREIGGGVAAAAPAALPANAPAELPAGKTDSLADHPGAVISPMVGTAYIAQEPGTPPFVGVGDMVEQGQTVLIVEAMKTMNPIAAPRGGRVTEILVANEQPVEFGQVLMLIE